MIIENAKKLRPACLAYLDHATNSFIEKISRVDARIQYIPWLQHSLTVRKIRMNVIRVSGDRFTLNNIKRSPIFAF